uniref:Uncharacterized protein n=1 Tax=Dulem virus 180 TaxID=3145657 RepID=A0AAU8B9B9_9VIRU
MLWLDAVDVVDVVFLVVINFLAVVSVCKLWQKDIVTRCLQE